jgi:hypothetical protein
MREKSDHKKAVQTSQRALQVARDAQAAVVAANREKKPSRWTPGRALLSAVIVLIGLLASIVGLLPHVTIEMGDPLDSSPYSSPINVRNGTIPLDRVGLKIGVCKLQPAPNIIIAGPNKDNCSTPSNAWITMPIWQHHRLGVDEPWRVLLSDVIDIQGLKFTGADLTLVVDYVPWPLSIMPGELFERHKEFRFQAGDKPDGKWRWYPRTIDGP